MSFRLDPVADLAAHNAKTIEGIVGEVKNGSFANLGGEVLDQIKEMMAGRGRGLVTDNLTGKAQRLLSLSEAEDAAKSLGLQGTVMHTKGGQELRSLPIIGVANHDQETGAITSMALQPLETRLGTEMLFKAPEIKWPAGTTPIPEFSARQVEVNNSGRMIAFSPNGVFPGLPREYGRGLTVAMQLNDTPLSRSFGELKASNMTIM